MIGRLVAKVELPGLAIRGPAVGPVAQRLHLDLKLPWVDLVVGIKVLEELAARDDQPAFPRGPGPTVGAVDDAHQIRARGGLPIAVGVEGTRELQDMVDDFIPVPKMDSRFYPFSMVVPLQLFAYFCALDLGRDVDQPRNLAKSVTVE